MPENVKRPNLEKSVKDELSHYEFRNHVTCINVEELSVYGCLNRDGIDLSDDCLEDCCRGHFNGRGKVHVPMPDNEDGGFIERRVEFSGTFEVIEYDYINKSFSTEITYASYTKI